MLDRYNLAAYAVRSMPEDIQKIAELVRQELAKPATETSDNTVVSAVHKPTPIDAEHLRATGIEELDLMLNGGIPENTTVLLAGGSGTGKTTLAMQWLVEGYKKYQEPGLYIAATEPLKKAINNLQRYGFGHDFAMSKDTIIFEDLRTIMSNLGIENKELSGDDFDRVIDEIEKLMTSWGSKRVVIDSITAIAYQLQDKATIRRFMYHMDALLASRNVNILMTSEVSGDGFSVFGVEEFMADGIIKLFRERQNDEFVRNIQIVKMRGVDFDSHPTAYRITQSGIKFFPRLSASLTYQVSDRRVKTGVQGLDAMTGGGYIQGSSIVVTGSSGTGKSIISLQFLLQGLKDGQKALLVSLEESKEQIARNARSFGWDLLGYEQSGQLSVLTTYPEQKFIEEHIGAIKSEVLSNKPSFVVIDSLSALGNAFPQETVRDFVSRLNVFLKENMVTTIYTHATATLLGADQITDAHLSTITDSIVMLRYVEIQSELHHSLLILKMRGTNHDKKLREVIFTPSGLAVVGEFSGLEGLLSGSTHKVSASVEEQLHALFMQYLGPMGEKIFTEEKVKGLTAESVKKLMAELSDQGVVSTRRKEEFLTTAGTIFGKSLVSEKVDKRTGGLIHLFNGGNRS